MDDADRIRAYPDAAMDNPWIRLPTNPAYVLDEDRELVERFNRTARPEHAIQQQCLPEPFLGRPDAPVVVLGLNPGYKPSDDHWHCEPSFVQRSRANLVHGQLDYPFFLLDPVLESPGIRWWTRKFRRLIEATALRSVAHGVLCVEYFPYHSRRFAHRRLMLPSQRYSFSLVERAMKREAVIVLLRSARHWFAAVPELVRYPRLHRILSAQNPTISPKNLPTGFAEVVAAVKHQASRPPGDDG